MRASNRALLCAFALLAAAAPARAGGPRYVTGPPFFTAPPGQPIGWRQPRLLYYTDPGDLSGSVTHAAADALVASAAAVWNVPVAGITVARGGSLAEHVSAANVFLDLNGLQLPLDLRPASAAAVPLAVLYDSDGSVTDLLLGSGASLPGQCRQNAVTESVDSFDPAGYILHALLIVNGRCSGPAPQQQLQLQYQLERAFGRVLGLAWSQTNDNVFTGSPTPTYAQAQNWPILHPLDIICGTYTYQCLPSPFQLRPDDIAALVSVYPLRGDVPIPDGKQPSLAHAQAIYGRVSFPTGEGMSGVNVLLRRQIFMGTAFDAWYETSAVTGSAFRRAGSSSFVPPDPSAYGSLGSTETAQLGAYSMPYFPVEGDLPWQDFTISTEPINSLYTGTHSIGAYTAGIVSASGSTASQTVYGIPKGTSTEFDFTVSDAASACGNGEDGTASSPVPVLLSGWWSGLLCPYGHAAYLAATVRPGRTFTLEVTALDEQGLPTTSKMMPVLGLFAPADSADALPSLGVTPTAFQSRDLGMTTLAGATGQLSAVRLGIADQRGDGRPDFHYNARLLYADTLVPAQIGAAGGTVTVSGLGFREGNSVSINGISVPATVTSANTIVLTAPTLASAHAAANVPVDVVVTDLGTGASSTLYAALTYTAGAPPNTMRLVTAPAGASYVGDPASAAFAVQVIGPNGTDPVAGEPVVFSVPAGSASFAACGASTCTVTTGTDGIASTAVTPTAAGAISLEAADGELIERASFDALDQTDHFFIWQQPTGNHPVGVDAGPINLIDRNANQNSLSGRAVTFSLAAGSALFSACSAPVCAVLTNVSGVISMGLTPTATGPVTVLIRDGDITASVSFNAVSNTDILRTSIAPTDVAGIGDAGNFEVSLLHADGVTPDLLQTVVFTAPAGVLLYPCIAQVCPVSTGFSGLARVGVDPKELGTFPIQAAFGTVTDTETIHVVAPVPQIKILSAPAGDVPLGSTAAAPFTVQLVFNGAPVPGQAVALSATQGAAALNICKAHDGTCYLYTGQDGTLSTTVTPLVAGLITLNAAYGAVVATSTFNATGAPGTFTVIQQPGPAGVWVGDPVPLSVKALAPGGALPLSNDPVVFSIAAGPFGFTDWFTSSVNRGTDSSGMAYEIGEAGGPGEIVLLVSDGKHTETIRFTARARPDTLRVLSAPAAGSLAGSAASQPFAVQVLLPDGTPATSRSVTLSVTDGRATINGCGPVPPCAIVTDPQGTVSATITPLAAGTIGLRASEGGVAIVASFTAVLPPDTIRIVSAPAPGSFVGAAAALPFAVQVFSWDGTPAASQPVTISVTNGSATLLGCPSASSCVFSTDAQGMVSTVVSPKSPGTITLLAAEGGAQVAASFTAVLPLDRLRLVSAPASGSLVGVAAAAPFSAQVLLADGSPAAGRSVILAVTGGSATLGACGTSASCALTTDAQGLLATTVTPSASGTISIAASDGDVRLLATFTAIARPDSLVLLSAPVSGAIVASAAPAPFTAELRGADGVPLAERSVTISGTNGLASFSACAGTASCVLQTDAQGRVSSSVTPLAAGQIALTASNGSLQQTATFTAVDGADKMALVSAPASGAFVGSSAAIPFTVRVLLPDGQTPAPDRSVTLTVTNGSATLAACAPISSCVVRSDAQGLVSSSVTPLAAGSITLAAAEGKVQQIATFTASLRPDLVVVSSSPASTLYAGATSATPLAIRVTLPDGRTPVAGVVVSFSLAAASVGTAHFAACLAAPCSLVTDSTGLVSSGVVAGTPGALTLIATAALPDGAQSVSAPLTVLSNRWSIVALDSSIYVFAGTAISVTLGAAVEENGSPTSGTTVAWKPSASLAPASLTFGSAQTVTAANGRASNQVLVAPLASGSTAAIDACLEPAPCASFTVYAVGADELQLHILQGAGQTAAPFAAVVAQVTDAAGHPVAGAPVAIYQAVTPQPNCPDRGRCPAVPTLRTEARVLVSAADGSVTVDPLAISGTATLTAILFTAGTDAAAQAVLSSHP